MSEIFDIKAFKVREKERAALKMALDPILSDILHAEESLSRITIFDDRARRHLGQARMELLHILADAQDVATSDSEKQLRMLAEFGEEETT